MTDGIQLRASALPLLQALLTAATTGGSTLLLVLTRPRRARALPFYSDASQRDPERAWLALGENLALLLAALSALSEGAWLWREAQRQRERARDAPRVARAYGCAAGVATACWWLTANTPTVRPFIRAHQLAASTLMVSLSVQASLKLRLSQLLPDLGDGGGADRDCASGGDGKPPRLRVRLEGWWLRHHVRVRAAVAAVLWGGVALTWLCFLTRAALRGVARAAWARAAALTAMTAVVHTTTAGALALMLLSAVDLRAQRVRLSVQPL